MTKDNKHKTEYDLDAFEQEFNKRYFIKKVFNAILCLIIAILGLSTILYSVFVNHMNLWDRLRFLTFQATIFTSIVSFIFSILCLLEIFLHKEYTGRWLYFLRLSSAVTELVLLVAVLLASTPMYPDHPDLTSFNGVVMHMIIPIATLVSFSCNDAPIGKLKGIEPMYGTWFLTYYMIVFSYIFTAGLLPEELAPYSILNFRTTPLSLSLFSLAAVYLCGYLTALFLSFLNRKLSWLWFYDIRKNKIQR